MMLCNKYLLTLGSLLSEEPASPSPSACSSPRFRSLFHYHSLCVCQINKIFFKKGEQMEVEVKVICS